MEDIVDKITKAAPSEIDLFAAAIQRRSELDDVQVTKILQKVFSNIDSDRLNPEMSLRYNSILNRLQK